MVTPYAHAGMSDTAERIEGALVFPLGSGAGCGVLRPDGSFCEFSREYRWVSRAMPAPERSEVTEKLPGTHLYGGWVPGHFGHVIVESLARLWPLRDASGERYESVIFGPGTNAPWRAYRAALPMLEAAAGDVPITFMRKPTRVERLLVPDPGFGTNNRIGGTPKFRAFIDNALRTGGAAEGAEKIYISRTGLRAHKSGLVGEAELEAFLIDHGYVAYHPERHSLNDQLAQYRAATHIVGADGSPFHLAGFVARPDCKVAVISRRDKGSFAETFRAQFAAFAQIDILPVDGELDFWAPVATDEKRFVPICNWDLARISTELAGAGFVPADAQLGNLSDSDLHDQLGALGFGPMARRGYSKFA